MKVKDILLHEGAKRQALGCGPRLLIVALGWLTVLASLAFCLLVSFGVLRAGAWNRPAIIVSSRPRLDDVNLKDIAAHYPNIGYFRSDSPFGSAILARDAIKPSPLTLIIEGKNRQMIQSQGHVGPRLKELTSSWREATRSPFVYAVVVGLLLGALFASYLRGSLEAIATPLFLVAFWKLTHACPTCPIAMLLTCSH